jgi:CheY-like chemotaxis protein
MKKILVIDDDMTFIAMMKASLDSEKYTVSSVGNGEQGLDAVKEDKPDLILLDLVMPKMGGMDFLKKLNEEYGAGKIPVLITSNQSSLENISEGVSLGIRGYFVKSNESLQGIAKIVDGVFEK